MRRGNVAEKNSMVMTLKLSDHREWCKSIAESVSCHQLTSESEVWVCSDDVWKLVAMETSVHGDRLLWRAVAMETSHRRDW